MYTINTRLLFFDGKLTDSTAVFVHNIKRSAVTPANEEFTNSYKNKSTKQRNHLWTQKNDDDSEHAGSLRIKHAEQHLLRHKTILSRIHTDEQLCHK